MKTLRRRKSEARILAVFVLAASLVAPVEAIGHGWRPKEPKPREPMPFQPMPEKPPTVLPSANVMATMRRKLRSTSPDRWDVWWTYHQDSVLGLKEKLRALESYSGSADWLLGQQERERIEPPAPVTTRAIRERVLPGLVEALEDRYADVRASAVLALGKIGDIRALPAILAALADEDGKVSESAALALGLLGDRTGAPVLRELLHDTPTGRRWVARPNGVPTRTRAFGAIGLGLIGEDRAAEILLDVVQEAARYSTRDIPASAAAALGLLGEKARPSVPALLRILGSERFDTAVRSAVAASLGKIGDPSALPRLRRALRETDLEVRRAAVLALGRLAEPGDVVTTEMLAREVRKGSDRVARCWACIALARIGGEAAERTLVRVVADESGMLRAYGAIALGLLLEGRPAGEGVRMLEAGFGNERAQEIRAAFSLALGLARARETEPVLAGQLTERSSPGLRAYSAVGLGLMGARSSAPILRDLVERANDPFVRQHAATSLGLLADRGAAGLLARLVVEADNESMRGSAAHALGLIGDASSIEVLVGILGGREGAGDPARAMAAVALGILAERRPVPAIQALAVDMNYLSAVDPVLEAIRIG
jgi:HEAT repeat protein